MPVEIIDDGRSANALMLIRGDKYRGKRQPSLWVRVQILKRRERFGRSEFLITPLDGSGRKWVTGQKLRWPEEQAT